MSATEFTASRDNGDERQSALDRATWRMPPLGKLAPQRMTSFTRMWMVVLRSYLVVAGGIVLFRIVALATGAG